MRNLIWVDRAGAFHSLCKSGSKRRMWLSVRKWEGCTWIRAIEFGRRLCHQKAIHFNSVQFEKQPTMCGLISSKKYWFLSLSFSLKQQRSDKVLRCNFDGLLCWHCTQTGQRTFSNLFCRIHTTVSLCFNRTTYEYFWQCLRITHSCSALCFHNRQWKGTFLLCLKFTWVESVLLHQYFWGRSCICFSDMSAGSARRRVRNGKQRNDEQRYCR